MSWVQRRALAYRLAIRHAGTIEESSTQGTIYHGRKLSRRQYFSTIQQFPKAVATSQPQHSHGNNPASSKQHTTSSSWKRVQEEADNLLEKVESNSFPTGMGAIHVKRLLVKMANMPRHAEKGPLAARLLEVARKDLEQSKHRDREELRAKLYQLTIEAWLGTIRGDRPGQSWDEAERLLWEILKNGQEAKLQIKDNKYYCNNLQRNVDVINGAFCLVVFQFCKGKEGTNGQPISPSRIRGRLEPILALMQQLWDDPVIPIVPSSSAVDAILYFHYKIQQATVAHAILKTVMDTTDNPFLRPTLHGMNTVISAHAKQGNIEEAKEIIMLMLDHSNSNIVLPRPNVVSFNALLDAIAHRGGQDAGQQAEEVLDWMQQHSFHPDTISFGTVISSWVKSGHSDAAERSEAILRHCMELHLSSGKRRDIGILFSSVVQAWSRSGRPDSADRATAAVDLMQSLYKKKNMPLEEMTHVFNSLIMVFARSMSQDMDTKLLGIVDKMHDIGVPTNAVTHNSIMSALLQSGPNGPQKALDYFWSLEAEVGTDDSSTTQLDDFSFNVALEAISKCDGADAPRLALDLLGRMINHHDIETTTTTYNTVMKVLAKSSFDDAAQQCEQLLKEMEDKPVSSTSRPSAFSYATCITAWGYTRLPERFERMSRLLQRMEAAHRAGNRDAQPNAVPFNTTLIGCCCGSDDRETALQCLLETLDLFRRIPGLRPNRQTYPLILRGIAFNCRDRARRDSLLLKEFENCAQDGFVCPESISVVQKASPFLLKSKLPEELVIDNGETIDIDKLPHSWRRNTIK